MAKITYTNKVTGAGAPTGQYSAEDANEVKAVVNANDLTVEPVTYEELVAMIGGEALVVGKQYLIEDFQTIYDRPDYDARSYHSPKSVIDTITASIEPIIVKALSTTELEVEAKSTLFPQDYIEYDVTYNLTYVNSSAAKGKIMLRKDTKFNNEAEFDWRNVTYKRYNHADGEGYSKYWDNGNGDFQLLGLFNHPTNIINDNVFKGWSESIYGQSNYGLPFDLPNNVIINGVGSYLTNNSVGIAFCNHFSEMNYNIIGDSFTNNIVISGFQFSNNIIGFDCDGNTIKGYFTDNKIDGSFYNNLFNKQFFHNIVELGFNDNTISSDTTHSTFIHYCSSLTFSGIEGVTSCRFDGFQSSVISGSLQNVDIINSFSITTGVGVFRNSTIKNSSNITIGGDGNQNLIEDSTNVTMGYNSSYNKFITCTNVSLGEYSTRNTFDLCGDTTFAGYCNRNNVRGTGYLTAANNCSQINAVDCMYITIDAYCTDITLNSNRDLSLTVEYNLNHVGSILPYFKLKELIDNNSLVVGANYMITDYQTIYDRPDFDSRGDYGAKTTIDTVTCAVEPLIVTALTNNKLYFVAKSMLYPTDYIEYDATYNLTYVNNAEAKGKITLRRDQFGNEAEFDWINVEFKRYNHADGLGYVYYWDDGNSDFQLMKLIKTYNRNTNAGTNIFINNKFSGWNKSIYSPMGFSLPFDLPNNVFEGVLGLENSFKLAYNNHIKCTGGSFQNNVIDAFFKDNILAGNTAASIDHCKIGDNCSGNNFKNTLGHVILQSLVVKRMFQNNTMTGTASYANVQFIGNNIGVGCVNNTFVGMFYYNIIEDNFHHNTFIDSPTGSQLNEFKNVHHCTFNNGLKKNSFKDAETIDFSAATHVYNDYNCEILKGGSSHVLTYIDGTSSLQIVTPNS